MLTAAYRHAILGNAPFSHTPAPALPPAVALFFVMIEFCTVPAVTYTPAPVDAVSPVKVTFASTAHLPYNHHRSHDPELIASDIDNAVADASCVVEVNGVFNCAPDGTVAFVDASL